MLLLIFILFTIRFLSANIVRLMFPLKTKEEKIGEISPIYRVSAGGETTHGGDKSARRFFAKNRQKIGDISPINRRHTGFSGDFFIKSPIYPMSPIYRRFFGDFLRKIARPTYLLHLSFRPPPTRDISAIFRLFFPIFSSLIPGKLKIDSSLVVIVKAFS